jgi:hypothetical protein
MTTYKIVHHHFRGDFNIYTNQPENPLNNTLVFNIKGYKMFFRFSKIEDINSTDKKIFINKIEYTREFPQDIINLFVTLGMMNTPTVFYLVYNMDFKVYYLKNTNTTTIFMLK